MKLFRRTAALAAFALMAFAAGVHADTLDDIQKNKTVRIAIDLGIPPWAYKNEKLEMAGSEVETAQLLAADLGAKLEVVPTTGANRIPFLMTNKADIVVSNLGITPERAKLIDFSQPYSAAANVVGAPKSMDIKSMADLAGKRIAVTRGTTNDTDVTSGAPKTTEIVRFDDEATTLTAVVTNQLDVIAQSASLIHVINKKNPSKNMEVKFAFRNVLFGVGIRKGDARMKQWVDQWVVTNLKNGKLNTIYRKYHEMDLPVDVTKNL